MDEKRTLDSSTSEKPASKESDLERVADFKGFTVRPFSFSSKAKHGVVEEDESDRSDVVDWDGEDDPMNPLNWTKTKKWVVGGLISTMTLIVPLASSMFAPSVPQVLDEFKETDSTMASFMVSIFILGYAVGPLFIAPLSEIYGRSPVYHITNVFFVLFTGCCAVSVNMGTLIAFRFLAGASGSCPITIGGGTVADMFRTEERGVAMAIWSLGTLLGPVIGPVGGAYLGQAKGWRWEFWVLVMASGLVTIAMFVFVEETYAPVLLKRKTERLRKETGNDQLKWKYDNGLSSREHLKRSIVRPLRLLFRSPVVFLLSLYMAVVYGYLYLLFTTMPEVFKSKYDWHGGSVGLAFLGTGIGMLFGLYISGATSDKLVNKLAERNGGVRKPEYRLPLMIYSAMTTPIGLFMYGWSAQYAIHWIVPIIGTGFVGVGLITSFMPVITYLTDAFTIFAASALAANTVLRALMGALLPLAGPSMYAALGLGWGNSLLGLIALAMVPFPIVFYKYGERIRTSKRFSINL